MRLLEQVEMRAQLSCWEAAPPAAAAELGLRARRVAGASCIAIRALPEVTMLNRCTGLGVAEPATDSVLDEIQELFAAAGVRYAIALAPDARPATVAGLLEARGFTPGYAWMKFRRGVEPLAAARTELHVELVERGAGLDFARVVTAGYDLPAALGGWLAALAETPGWRCYVARDGEDAVAAGALFADGAAGWLGFAATLPEHRGRGGQGAILAARIRDAAALGVVTLVSETGERTTGRPSASYRNLLRSGFEEVYRRPNYIASQ